MWKLNHKAFSLVELIVAMGVSLLVAGAIFQILFFQSRSLTGQKAALEMQQNGRAAIDFLTRSIQNSGYQLSRGQKIEAASDRYITVVYDENDDNVIQNSEVFTYALSKATGTATETFSITPFFDDDSDGTVEASESRTYNIPLVLNGPPYDLLKFIPNNGAAALTTTAIAQNFDYLTFRYYDENDLPLPVTVDGGGNRIAPTPPYQLSQPERNSIRRVEVEVMARARKRDLNYRGSGTYPNFSLATYNADGDPQAGVTYDDNYRRTLLSTAVAPRNLILNPWGNLTMNAVPQSVACPTSNTTVTATLVDTSGDEISGTTIAFLSDAGTLSPSSDSTDNDGEASTTISYDWTDLSKTITVSASATIDIDPGAGVDNKTIYNATPVYFEAGTTATWFEDFNDGQANEWAVVAGTWDVTGNVYQPTGTPSDPAIAIVGCSSWQDYVYEAKLYQNGNTDEDLGILVRYQDQNRYYYVGVIEGTPPDAQLVIVKKNVSESDVVPPTPTTHEHNQWYSLKVQVQDNTIKAKYWRVGDTEPVNWMLEATDGSSPYTSGKVGLRTDNGHAQFDDINLYPIP